MSFGIFTEASVTYKMSRFEIYADGSHVGWSELEHGDPPMGVAFGCFIPTASYGAIQERIIAETASGQTSFHFQVKAPMQVWIKAVGVSISDYSKEVGVEGIEVSVLGISNPPYEQLFPDHVDAYKRSFQR